MRRNLKCPNCARLLINRSSPSCTYCEQPVPKEFHAIQKVLDLAAGQRRIKRRREEEEASRMNALLASMVVSFSC
jgi:hypothetical protein